MPRRPLSRSPWVAAITAAACLALAPASAIGAESVGVMNVNAAAIDWSPAVAGDRLVLRVAGPGGFLITEEFAAGANPTFSLYDQAGHALADGVYKYELWVVPQLAHRRQLERARAAGEVVESRQTPRIQSGAFTIRDGSFVSPAAEEERGGGAPAGGQPSLALRDFVIADDLIVQGSTCSGLDCVNNEDFGFDTIRLKENNTRIQFNDTSTTSGFPTNNWQIRANSSASGGLNFLAFVDQGATGTSETGTIVFGVEGGAAADSLWVDTGKRVGIGTSTPVLNLHVKTGNTPALRLEQDNSSGFAPQTWDVAGNETTFFIRDVTSGSRLPFRIQPGAASDTLFINAGSLVGIGTSAPTEKLHVVVGGSEADRTIMRLSNNGQTNFFITDTSADGDSWKLGNVNGGFQISRDGSGVTEFLVQDNGNVQIPGGSMYLGSDRNKKEHVTPIDAHQILDQLAGLPIASWSWKADAGAVRHLGPMAQDFYAAFGLGQDDVTVTPLDVTGVALAAIQGLNLTIQDLESQVTELRAQLAELQAGKPAH